jgi:hypothetical protein
MIIQMTTSRFGASGLLYAAGTQYDVPDALAFSWIGSGVAVPATALVREAVQDTGPRLLDDGGNLRALVEVTDTAAVLTASGTAFTGPCEYAGYNVSVLSSGTLTVYDNTAASGKVIDGPITLTLGQRQLNFKIACQNGCYFAFSAAGNTVTPEVG